eukprot:jgi/Mesen1/10273/ME000785S09550
MVGEHWREWTATRLKNVNCSARIDQPAWTRRTKKKKPAIREPAHSDIYQIIQCFDSLQAQTIRALVQNKQAYSYRQEIRGCTLNVATPDAPQYVGALLAEPYRHTRFELGFDCRNASQHLLWADGPGDELQEERGSSSSSSSSRGRSAVYRELGASKLRVTVCQASPASVTVTSNSGGGLPGAEGQPCHGGPTLLAFDVPVVVVYVRRDVRNLTVGDRRDYFEAIKIMSNTSATEGRRRFGKFFRNYDEYVALHAATVWGAPCDAAHFGPAFAQAHRAFLRDYEASIQAIFPRLAAPYWDMLTDGELPDPTKSALWTDGFYGSLQGDPADSYIVKDGPFTFWPIPRGANAVRLSAARFNGLGPSGIVSPFGFQRGRNNLNAAPYLTRLGPANFEGSSLPRNCDWARCRQLASYGDWSRCFGLQRQSASLPRCDPANVFRRTYNKMVGGWGEQRVPYFPPVALRNASLAFAKYGLCSSVSEGDYLDLATSAHDPIFWVHHAFADRALVSWRLIHSELPWERVNFTSPSGDNDVYPDWLSATCRPGVMAGGPHPGVFGEGDLDKTGHCTGHGLHDPVCFGAFSNTFRSLPKDKAYTNMDFLNSVDTQLFDLA